jgi:hypothetical protein
VAAADHWFDTSLSGELITRSKDVFTAIGESSQRSAFQRSVKAKIKDKVNRFKAKRQGKR